MAQLTVWCIESYLTVAGFLVICLINLRHHLAGLPTLISGPKLV